MDYITTTDLRTKSPELVAALEAGKSVKLVHRSKVVGTIDPPTREPVLFDSAAVKKIVAHIPKLPHLSDEERDRIYREEMEKKHGALISGR